MSVVADADLQIECLCSAFLLKFLKVSHVNSGFSFFLCWNSPQERVEQISEHVSMGGKRDCLDLLARAVAPSISGYLDVKKAVCGSKFLAQVGSVQHELLD